jgi:drug/metabolite transporter (DMT)-like permease
MLYALWAAAGWCGTPWPGWWRGPRPKPDPEPWWIVVVAGIVGGVIGGYLTSRIIPGTDVGAVATLTTTVGAFVFGRVLGDLAIHLTGGRGNVAVGG